MSKTSNWKWEEEYEALDELGEGGNAEVIRVRKVETGKEYALKPLKKDYARSSKKPEKRERFKKEIAVINQFKDEILGILPIVDFMIDDENKEYWYVMPIATEIKKELESHKDDYTFIVNGIIQLADTLDKLHENGRSHRDIKPENIYYFNERFYIGDFGLVSFLDTEASFTEACALGAYSTMAPEMRRDPHISDGKKADVYSLAKTLWILLTKKEKGFDGVYNFRDKKIGLRYDSIVSAVHIVELEELLQESTDNDPDKRPTMLEFKTRLEQWLKMSPSNFYSDEIQNSEWRFINSYLFGDGKIYIPEIVVWEDKDKIREILSLVASLPAFNHMLSGKGGLDFCGAEDANEADCLYLYEEIICNVVKPKRLIFCNFLEDPRWNYFLLELDELAPIIDSDVSDSFFSEMLVEDIPGNYVSAQYSAYGVYDYDTGEPYPEGWKIVRRCSRGKFLICPKYGPYNSIPSTYDGRHTQCSAARFRVYILWLIDICKECKKNGINEEYALCDPDITKNPFVSEESDEDESEKIEIQEKENATPIEDALTKWNFIEYLHESISSDVNASRFKIVYAKNRFLFDLTHRFNKSLVLCIDGYFKESYTNDEVFYCRSIESVFKIKESIRRRTEELCQELSIKIDFCGLCFDADVEFLDHKPKHLFTKKEIEELMRNADDRHNNVLVVNADGYAEIIQDDIAKANFYPVSHESWVSGNKYVGKYSNLSSLDNDYITSLQGWLRFLQERHHIRMDYVHENTNEDELIAEIKKYYE